MSNTTNSSDPFLNFISGESGKAQATEGIQVKAFVLNLAIALATFTVQVSGFFLLKSSGIGRRIYQPKTYLVQHRLRVEPVPVSPLKWLRRVWGLEDQELMAKCGLDGYFFIRLLRAMVIIFVPAMCLIVPVLLPINFHEGRNRNEIMLQGQTVRFNVTGLDTLSWQNVSPAKTRRYWGHLVCALLIISWTLYRIYSEKLNFIDVRQRFLTSPEHRLKASARTVLITNIPTEYRSIAALEALYDVFVDNDDRSRLTVWVNRDYASLRALVNRRRSLRHRLEKAELKILRKRNSNELTVANERPTTSSSDLLNEYGSITMAFEKDCEQELRSDVSQTKSSASQIVIVQQGSGSWQPVPRYKFWIKGSRRTVPEVAWLRFEIARLTIDIESLLQKLDDDSIFLKQNSAFIQFDRQMAAHMCCALVSHDKPGRMSPRYLEAAPHEIIWPNMNVTSSARVLRSCLALVIFVAMLFLWGIPTTILATISQLDAVRASVSWLYWLRSWPSWIISLISGPLVAILLFLLVQLVVPALCRKLAVLVGAPTRSKRELIAQDFYFTFLFIELVLVTAISSGIVNVIPKIVNNPTGIPTILATNLPRSANYFFNYLIVQSLTFSGSLLFQYLRILYISTIWPWFTQTPREEAWLQTTIPHQMWANQYSLMTNFAVIGLIYSIISPLMLVIISFTFCMFWVAYRHNYYFVQRNKIDTHGLLFNNALSQLFAGVYVLEISLIGLFFLVRDTEDKVACSSQAIIMIVVLIITAIFHFVMEQHLRPLYNYIPVTLEDTAADAERERFLIHDDDKKPSAAVDPHATEKHENYGTTTSIDSPYLVTDTTQRRARAATGASTHTAASARHALAKVKLRAQLSSASPLAYNRNPAAVSTSPDSAVRKKSISHRREIADQLGAAISAYPDELTDLSPEELQANLSAAFQDPVTREPRPIIWIPQDDAGLSSQRIHRVEDLYGKYDSDKGDDGKGLQETESGGTQGHQSAGAPGLVYSNSGAYLTKGGKVQITQPAPDIRADWCLEWEL